MSSGKLGMKAGRPSAAKAGPTLSDLADKQLKKIGGDVSVLRDARRIRESSRVKSMSAVA